MDYKEIMPNDKITVMINDIHNKWWRSAREFDEKSDKEEVAKSMQALMKYVEANYSNYPIACKIMEAYIDELDARVKFFERLCQDVGRRVPESFFTFGTIPSV